MRPTPHVLQRYLHPLKKSPTPRQALTLPESPLTDTHTSSDLFTEISTHPHSCPLTKIHSPPQSPSQRQTHPPLIPQPRVSSLSPFILKFREVGGNIDRTFGGSPSTKHASPPPARKTRVARRNRQNLDTLPRERTGAISLHSQLTSPESSWVSSGPDDRTLGPQRIGPQPHRNSHHLPYTPSSHTFGVSIPVTRLPSGTTFVRAPDMCIPEDGSLVPHLLPVWAFLSRGFGKVSCSQYGKGSLTPGLWPQ